MELNEETNAEVVTISAEERAEEQKLIRRLQMMMNMVMQVIAQDGSLTVDDASQMIADSRKAALGHVPGQRARLRPHLAATLPTPHARTISNYVTSKVSNKATPPLLIRWKNHAYTSRYEE